MVNPFPQYKIPAGALALFDANLRKYKLQLICTRPKNLLKDGLTLYTEWEIKDGNGLRVIMWAKEASSNVNKEAIVTVGTPNGRKGWKLLEDVQKILSDIAKNEATNAGKMPTQP